jgi:hypothetical protein
MLEVTWGQKHDQKGSRMVSCQEKIALGVSQAFLTAILFHFPPSDFLHQKNKITSTRILVCSSKHVFRIKIRRPKIFDVYTDWRSIRQEPFARYTKLDLYEFVGLPGPPRPRAGGAAGAVGVAVCQVAAVQAAVLNVHQQARPAGGGEPSRG